MTSGCDGARTVETVLGLRSNSPSTSISSPSSPSTVVSISGRLYPPKRLELCLMGANFPEASANPGLPHLQPWSSPSARPSMNLGGGKGGGASAGRDCGMVMGAREEEEEREL